MTKEELAIFMQQHSLAVLSTLSGQGRPESALIAIAVTDELEIIFDTVSTSRKFSNLQSNPNVALVLGWDSEITLQYEGVARQPAAEDRERYKELYYRVRPDGRERQHLPEIVYLVVHPDWIRYSDFRKQPPLIIEFDEVSLR